MASTDRAVSPLHVAVLSALLLVAVVGVDVAFNATTSLDVRTDDGWRTLATVPEDRDRFDRREPLVEVNRTEAVDFRVVVDNQRPLDFEAPYAVRVHGETVADGRLSAPSLGAGEATFTVPGETLLGPPGDQGEGPQPPRVAGLQVELTLGDDTTYAFAELREVER